MLDNTKIKVCGINDTENLVAISQLDVDYIGLNFYPPSSRYINIGDTKFKDQCNKIEVSKVGVFVNENIGTIRNIVDSYGLEYVQLHGNEDISFCKQIAGFSKVIKVFRIGNSFDFSQLDNFTFCDLLLFDTDSSTFGGSGKVFDWSILENYKGNKKYLLAGGIGPQHAPEILKIQYTNCGGADINSKFEITPGIKNVDLVKDFIIKVKGIKVNT